MTKTALGMLVGAVAACAYTVARMFSRNAHKIRLDDILMFSLMCVGIVTGTGFFFEAFERASKAEDEAALFTGVAGASLACFTAAKAINMVRAIFKKGTPE